MAFKSAAKSASAKAANAARPPITIERARLLCPNAVVAEKVAAAFGLSVPDFEGIQTAHENALRQTWLSFDDALNEKATQMHFQRITGSLVSSALGAGDFYSTKVTEARDATAKLANEDRDEIETPQPVLIAGPNGCASSRPRWQCKPTHCSPPPKAP